MDGFGRQIELMVYTMIAAAFVGGAVVGVFLFWLIRRFTGG